MPPIDWTKNVTTANILANGDQWELITPGPGDLPRLYRSIFVKTTGNVTMVDSAGTVLDLTAVVANQTIDGPRPTKITAATAVLYGIK